MFDTSQYPSPQAFLNDLNENVPATLLEFLNVFKKRKESEEKFNRKRSTIAHVIMKNLTVVGCRNWSTYLDRSPTLGSDGLLF